MSAGVGARTSSTAACCSHASARSNNSSDRGIVSLPSLRYTRAMLFDRKKIYDGRVIQVSVDTVDLPNGMRLPLEIVRHPGRRRGGGASMPRIASACCASIDTRRAATSTSCPPASSNRTSRPRSPCGGSSSRKRRVSAAHWESLGAYFSSPGVFTEVIHLYLATELSPATAASRSRRGFRDRMVAARTGRRARAQRGTHRCEDNHRNSAGRVTKKNCVKRLTALRFGVPEMVAMSNNRISRVVSYFGP